MRVIFIDIDGVLNNLESGNFIFFNSEKYGLDKSNVLCLKKILNDVPDTYLILSSSWRNYPEDHIMYNHANAEFKSPIKQFKNIFGEYIKGICCHKKGQTKQQDILDYINNYGVNIEDFIIIDDDVNQGLQYFGKQFFRTDFHKGLTISDVFDIIQYFIGDKL